MPCRLADVDDGRARRPATGRNDRRRRPRRRRRPSTGRPRSPATAAAPAAAARRSASKGCPTPPADLAYVIVIEAGASDYSASPVAREEFPDLDATTRGTISIGRRLQDPLAELVKIDPQHIGVGLYQHDVKPKHLKESLEGGHRVERQRRSAWT